MVATQESFARISEEAAGRLQAISGKVEASESSVNTGSEALKLQIRQLKASLAEQSKQQQGVAGQAGIWASVWSRSWPIPVHSKSGDRIAEPVAGAAQGGQW